MVNITLEIKGLDKIQKAYAEYPTIAGKEIKRGIGRILKVVERSTVGAPKFPVKTGLLKGNRQVRMLSDTTGILRFLQNYAVFVHEGTSKMKGRPFLRIGIDKAQQKIDNESDKILERIIDNLVK